MVATWKFRHNIIGNTDYSTIKEGVFPDFVFKLLTWPSKTSF